MYSIIRSHQERDRWEEATEVKSFQHSHSCSCSLDHLDGTPPLSPTHLSWPLCGGRFALWFCLLLLQQPHEGFGSPVTRGSIQLLTMQNDSFFPVNTFVRPNLPLLNARMEHTGSAKSQSSKFVSRRLKSDPNIDYFVRRGKKGFPSSFSSVTSPSKRRTSSHAYSGFKSAALPPHSTGVQTTSGQPTSQGAKAITKVAALSSSMRRLRQPSNGAFSDRYHGSLRNAHYMPRLPHPQWVKVFIDYINPYIKQGINPLQIQFIVNQWHLFHKTQRFNHRMQQLRAAESRKQSEIQHFKKKELVGKVVLRREAQALKKATSFDEFKRILLRANLKNTTPEQISWEDVVNPHDHKEITKDLSHSPLTHAEEKRSIWKRSLDAREVPTFSLSSAHALPSRNVTVDSYMKDETEDHSDEELREAYNSYNDFINNACAPRNKTLCTKSFLPRDRVGRSTLFLPPGIYVKRCDNPEWNPFYGGSSIVNSYQAMFSQATHLRSRTALKSLCAAADRVDADSTANTIRPGFTDIQYFDTGGSCTCLLPEEECLPTEVRLKVDSVVVYDTAQGTTTTEVIALTEHVSCACQRRCENRRCVSPLQLNNYTYDDCYCSCPMGDARCEALLDGREKFTDEELPLPLNGSYILPPCYHGPMNEEHLYHRHCPYQMDE